MSNTIHNGQAQQASQIELRSEEVNEIMGYIPHWIIRWGITVMFLSVIAALALSWFVKYPDMLPAQVVITSDPPPLRLEAPVSAKVNHIFVEEGAAVAKDDWLIAFEAAADWQDIRSLETQLAQADTHALLNLLPLRDRNLGSVQLAYSTLRQSLEDWKFFNESGRFRATTRSGTSRQARELEALNANIAEQLLLRRREVALAENEFNINKKLFEQGTMSRVDLERSEVDLIQKRLAIKQLEAQVHNNEIQIWSYRQRLGDFGQQTKQSALSLEVAAHEAFLQLRSAIRTWKQQYLILAPEDGTVAFFDMWASSQQVDQGTAVVSILPKAERIIGKATISQEGAGKLKVGQTANIKLDNYDNKEFGMLVARVSHISPIPKKNQYLIDLELEHGLTTTYDKSLEFNAELFGKAEIITEELRLLERIFYDFRKMFT